MAVLCSVNNQLCLWRTDLLNKYTCIFRQNYSVMTLAKDVENVILILLYSARFYVFDSYSTCWPVENVQTNARYVKMLMAIQWPLKID